MLTQETLNKPKNTSALWPQHALMVDPQYFNITYSINPHMQNADGSLKKIDSTLAKKQWNELHKTLQSLGLHVQVLPADPSCPDMVFCANQMFPFYKNGRLEIILSQMNSSLRQPEVEHFKKWCKYNHVTYHHLTLPHGSSFEAMGDLLWNYATCELFGGYGFRTHFKVYDAIEKIVGQKIHRLELIDEHFYHLDTCFHPINKNTALVVKEAFNDDGWKTLQELYKDLIAIPWNEAMNGFAANSCIVNGKDVIIPFGCDHTQKELEARQFKTHTVDTSEFIKAGGSVFCMKLLF